MIKQYTKWLCAVVLCFAVLAACAVTAFAEEITLVELNTRQSIIISLSYDKEEPSFIIKSPSGKTYSSDADYTAVERGNTAVYLYIRDAERGVWTIDCDKKGNTSVEATVVPWEEALTIDSLIVESFEENTLIASAAVSCEKQRNFDYYLYAVVLDENRNAADSRLIASGRSRSGNTFNIKADTSDLPDGEYHLELEAVFTADNGVEMPTFFISDSTFTVTGNVSEGENQTLVSELDLPYETLTLDWSASEDNVTSWELALYTRMPGLSSDKPYYYAEFSSDTSKDKIILNRELGDVDVKLTGTLKNGGYVKYEKTIVWDNGITVSFDTPELTNAYSALISYDTGGHSLRAFITLNGSSEELRLSGKSSVSLKLSDMEVNEISLKYSYEDGSYYVMSQRITVDSIPPSIDLYGITDYVYSSKDKITISGKTEAGAVLTINGQPQAIEDNGSFTATLSLEKGKNNIVIEAQDMAGNKISRSFTVDRTTTSGTASENEDIFASEFPWVIVAALAGTLFTFLMIFIFCKKCNSRLEKNNINKFRNLYRVIAVLKGVFAGLCATSAGIAAFFFIRARILESYISGSNLANTAQYYTPDEFVQIVLQVKSQAEGFMKYFIIFLITAGILLAVFIGMIVLDKLMFKKHLSSVCPSCGEKITKNTMFCTKCGTEIKRVNIKQKDEKVSEDGKESNDEQKPDDNKE